MKKKLNRIFLIFITVIFAITMSLFSVACDISNIFGGKDEEQTNTEPPEEEPPEEEEPEGPVILGDDATTVRKELPADGTLPTEAAPLDNIGYMATVLDGQPYYHTYSCNSVTMTGYEQSIRSWKDYKDAQPGGEEQPVTIESELSYSTLIKRATQTCFLGSDKAIIRSGSKPQNKNNTPFDIEWSTNLPSVYDKDNYKHIYGEFSTEISVFVINQDTLDSADDVIDNTDGTFTQTFYLNKFAAVWYQYALKTKEDLKNFPEFKKIEITFTFNEKWEILESYCEDNVTVSPKVLLGVNTPYASHTTTIFDYTEEGFSASGKYYELCGGYFDSASHYNYYDYFKNYQDYVPEISDEVVEGNLTEIAGSKLSIHFLELGSGKTGDSILIKCGDTEVLIDAGAVQSSASTIKSYINKYCTDGKLEYVIATHTDTDHIAAFFGNSSGGVYNGILYSYEIGTIIYFDKVYKSTSNYTKFRDAVAYAEEHGANVYTASQCYDEKDGAQRQYYLDDEHTVSLNVLYNYYYYNVSSDENNHSVVTLLTEEFDGGVKRNYLFTGDLEEDGESRMVDYYKSVPAGYDTEYNVLPEVVLYKAGHHGSKTSSTEKLLEVIKPKYVAVCCCAGSPEYTKTNVNMFPTQEMINHIAKYTDKIYVTSLTTSANERDENGNFKTQNHGQFTSMNGNIVFYSTGNEIKLYCSNNSTVLKDTDWFKENRTWPSSSE